MVKFLLSLNLDLIFEFHKLKKNTVLGISWSQDVKKLFTVKDERK